jgi:hypothetical protein
VHLHLMHQREQLFQRELQQDLKKLLKNSQRFKMSLRKRRKRSLMKLKLRKKILPTSLKSSPISKLRLPLTLRNWNWLLLRENLREKLFNHMVLLLDQQLHQMRDYLSLKVKLKNSPRRSMIWEQK